MIRLLSGIALAIYAFLQFYSIPYSPLPWFDEVFFADISYNLYKNGTFIPQVAIFQPEYSYGFVHFLFAALSFKFLGFGLIAYRWLNYLFGALVVWMWLKILQKEQPISQDSQPFWALLLLCDPLFNLSMHEGRMDLTALFFMLLGIYFVQDKQAINWKNIIFSAVCIALALLTTPRIGFLLIALGGYWIYYLFLNWRKNFFLLIGWCLIIFLLYSIWVRYAFGSYYAFLNYYLGDTQWKIYKTYLGFSGYIPKQSYLLITVSIFSMLIVFFFALKTQTYKAFYAFIVASIVSFYVIVYDLGPYSIFIIPFYYFWIAKISHLQTNFLPKWVFALPAIGLFFFNLSYFSLKNIQIFTSLAQRSPAHAEAFVRKHIPPKSRVVSEPMYYYAVKRAGSEMQFMNYFEELEQREHRQRTKWQYEYLIVTEHLLWRDKPTVSYYFSKADFEPIAHLHIPQNSFSRWLDAQGWLSTTERTGYNAIIYKRIPTNPEIPKPLLAKLCK
ncbi:MAG: hypothetical protein NZ551_07635 [Microscillaceae bacterium]|nr:hypothetical protein [Microscillaceae bacterium]MDW8461067.1 hypothetical protein [Cytophagales bacterium]